MQLGANEDGAKFFRAHAVPQGRCENLINALKLLANQQKDGDNPIQNIIMGLKEKCKERITNGLRSFIASDNYSAVGSGNLRRGHGVFKVVRPKMNGYRSEVLREEAGDLTLRAEAFDPLKARFNVDHIDQNFRRPSLVEADWCAFCQAIHKRTDRSEWEELYRHYREMSTAAGAQKKSESQKAEALWQRQGDEFYNSANNEKRTNVGRTHRLSKPTPFPLGKSVLETPKSVPISHLPSSLSWAFAQRCRSMFSQHNIPTSQPNPTLSPDFWPCALMCFRTVMQCADISTCLP